MIEHEWDDTGLRVVSRMLDGETGMVQTTTDFTRPIRGTERDEKERLIETTMILYLDAERRDTATTRRIGDWAVTVSTGPPTWWLPRLRIKRRSVTVGWLRLMVRVAHGG